MRGIFVLTKYFGILVLTKFNLSGERGGERYFGIDRCLNFHTCAPAFTYGLNSSSTKIGIFFVFFTIQNLRVSETYI